MRKIAAHYYLRPDNTIGKFPVITFDSLGCITEIRERDSFVEEPFMEHVSGLLVPGFVSYLSDSFFSLSGDIQIKNINELNNQGNIVLCCSVNFMSQLQLLLQKFPRIKGLIADSSLNYFAVDGIKEANSILDFFKYDYGIKISPLKEVEDICLTEGATPGILALSGIGGPPFRWTRKSKIKVIL